MPVCLPGTTNGKPGPLQFILQGTQLGQYEVTLSTYCSKLLHMNKCYTCGARVCTMFISFGKNTASTNFIVVGKTIASTNVHRVSTGAHRIQGDI